MDKNQFSSSKPAVKVKTQHQEEEATEPTNVPSRRDVFPTLWDYMSWEFGKLRVNHKKKRKTEATKPPVEPPNRCLKKAKSSLPQKGMCPFLQRAACVCTSNVGQCSHEQQNFFRC